MATLVRIVARLYLAVLYHTGRPPSAAAADREVPRNFYPLS